MFSDPKQSVLKQINHLLEKEGGVHIRKNNAFWWHHSLTPMDLRHALLICAHRLHIRYKDATWTPKNAPNVKILCPLCRKATEIEHCALER